nr:predicted GPI-anchored protein 58 [Lolium perenne]
MTGKQPEQSIVPPREGRGPRGPDLAQSARAARREAACRTTPADLRRPAWNHHLPDHHRADARWARPASPAPAPARRGRPTNLTVSTTSSPHARAPPYSAAPHGTAASQPTTASTPAWARPVSPAPTPAWERPARAPHRVHRELAPSRHRGEASGSGGGGGP